LLKFLRIPPFTGPMVQSIMDTLQASKVVIFEFIILYVVVISSFSYHVAFGPDLNFYDNYYESFLSLFQVVFGNTDYSDLNNSNKVFGPLLFLFFMLFLIFVLMNLLIGVLGNAYNDVQEVNVHNYDRFITRLMIEDEEERCLPKDKKKEWKIVTLMRSLIHHEDRNTVDVEMATASTDQLAAEKDDSPDETPIYNNDDELDEMIPDILEEEEEAESEQANKEKDEEIQKITERLEALERYQQDMSNAYKKDFVDLSVKLNALIDIVKNKN